MNLYTFTIIVLWSFVGLFVIAAFILTFFYGRSTIKDNPNKALIYVKTGKHIQKPMKGVLANKPSQKGCIYNYKDGKVFVPFTYGDYYINNRRMIFIDHIGQLVASPFGKDIALVSDEKEELIYELVASHIGADSVKALKGKQTMPIIIIAAAAFIIGIIVVFGYNYISEQTVQQDATQQKPAIEIKPAP